MENEKRRIFPIQDSIEIIVENFNPDAIAHALKQDIDSCWNLLQQQGTCLYEGWIFSVDAWNFSSIKGHFIPYRYYAAWYRQPDLRTYLEIKPLSASAITHTQEQVLIGKRSASVLQYPGFFEFPPSGGIDLESRKEDTIDHKGLILKELHEETGITQKQVKAVTLFALLEDIEEGTLDLCYDILISDDAILIPQEYDSLSFISQKELPAFLLKNQSVIIPASLLIWNFWQKKSNHFLG